MSSNRPKVEIHISSRNRRAFVLDTLKSLCSVRVPHGLFVELVFVDNGSTDDTADAVSSFATPPDLGVSILREGKPGKARALNKALNQSEAEAILFTDDDVRFPRDWIERMVQPILSGEADAVAGGIRFAPHLNKPWLSPDHRIYLASTEMKTDQNKILVGANMAIRRSALQRVGGFHEDLGPGASGFGEETLISYRLARLGARVVSKLDCEVEHHFDEDRLSRKAWRKIGEDMGRSNALLCLLEGTADLNNLHIRHLRARALVRLWEIRASRTDVTPIQLVDAYSRWGMLEEYQESFEHGSRAHRLLVEGQQHL